MSEEKETIINGIDVSECDYFEKQHIEDMYESDDCNVCIDNYCALCWKECEKHNGCYFKQLKRLQEENEELKKYQYTQEYLQSEIEKRQKALEEIRDLFDAIVNRKLQTFNEIDTGKIILAIRKRVIEVLNDQN